MAYLNWGGFSFRDGFAIHERSDCNLKDVYRRQGDAHPPHAQSTDIHVRRILDNGSYHALLGDGLLCVGLYKRDIDLVLAEKDKFLLLDLPDLICHQYANDVDLLSKTIKEYDDGTKYFDSDYIEQKRKPLEISVTGYKIKFYKLNIGGPKKYEEYQPIIAARMIQPDGVIWIGYSGLYVGAGYDDDGHTRYHRRYYGTNEGFNDKIIDDLSKRFEVPLIKKSRHP